MRPSWRIARSLALIMAAGGLALAIFIASAGLRLWKAYDPEAALTLVHSPRLLDRTGQELHAFLNPDDHWAFPMGDPAKNPWLEKATIAAEDQRFYQHRGVDLTAIGRAAWQAISSGGLRSGASTLTMQVVKLGGIPSNTLPGKLKQTLLAWRLERAADKEAILRAYFDKAPYGLNLIGVEAAARRYFGKPAIELNLAEAATLAALPKAPSRLQPLRHPQAALERRNYVLRRMAQEGYLSQTQCAEAQATPLGARWHDFPQQAPHLAQRLQPTVSQGATRQLTLDSAIQRDLEARLPRYLQRFDNAITNAAAMVLRLDTMEVIARVGAADFYHTPGGGQVDVTRAPRSPGSTLKPFTYALAIDQHRLYPSEYLLDDTLDFGSYNPGNFDGQYFGLITAAEALHYSLNIPALQVLHRIGPEAFYGFLETAGLRTLKRAPGEYGLGLTLGNCEVRLEEMMAAYAMLANLGVYRPLRESIDAPASPGKRLLSEGTAWALYTMLEAPLPNELSDSFVRTEGVKNRLCWKTGTSTGLLDAWAFVFNRHYLVGVWLGNNTARPSQQLVGATAALPLAGAIFRSLKPLDIPAWPQGGEALHPVQICAVSGLPASPWCQQQKEILLPKSFYLNRRCDLHRPKVGGEGVQACWPGSAMHWDLAAIQNAAPNAQQAEETEVIRQLRIERPVNRAEYILTGEAKGDCLHLKASTESHSILYWYLNDRYLGLSTPDTPLFLDLAAGKHRLTCMSPAGEKDTVEYAVSHPGEVKPLIERQS